MENKNFKYIDSYSNSHEITIDKKDFDFVQKDEKIHDLKLEGKPTTYFKDSLKRFTKNKSSVAGTVILGIIVLGAIIIPFTGGNVDSFNVNQSSIVANFGLKSRAAITPKLFSAGTGFWDGTYVKEDIIVDQNTGLPVGYRESCVTNLETRETYSNTPGQYGKGGQAILSYKSNSSGDYYYENPGDYYCYPYNFDFNYDYTITYDFPENTLSNYDSARYRISLVRDAASSNSEYYPLTGEVSGKVPFTGAFEDGFISDFTNETTASYSINLSEKMREYGVESLENASIMIEVERNFDTSKKTAILIDSLTIESSDDPNAADLKERSIVDGNDVLIQSQTIQNETGLGSYDNISYWNGRYGSTAGNNIKYVYSNFTYDQYEDIFGVATLTVEDYQIAAWVKQGIISYTPGKASDDAEEVSARIEILKPEECPIVEIYEQIGNAQYDAFTDEYYGFSIKCDCVQYMMFGYDEMPTFLFGTDRKGRDFLKVIFTSLRTSLLIAIGVSAINIAFGLVWGAISGYYGGWTDIVMERFCDILSGIPSIAIITLCILYLNSDVIAFGLSMFLTGWMGVSSRTRTQFYRYKGREYVLASRSLGAKDGRLVFKHILPNSIGTIITSSVLMIPSVIYSEASIAYLNLGLNSQMLFGVILSENRTEFNSYSVYLLIIPTMIMLFLLVAFNLFGNGLRDAFNPQLKGSE